MCSPLSPNSPATCGKRPSAGGGKSPPVLLPCKTRAAGTFPSHPAKSTAAEIALLQTKPSPD